MTTDDPQFVFDTDGEAWKEEITAQKRRGESGVDKKLEADFCLGLKKQGKSFREIAKLAEVRFGRKFSHATVAARVNSELARVMKLRGTDLAVRRVMELEKLDTAEQKVWEVLSRPHVMVNGGKIVTDAEGDPLMDDGPTLAAVDRLLKIAERRSKFEGLDAPTRVDAQVTHVQVDSRVTQLIENARLRIKAERVKEIEQQEVFDAEFSDVPEDSSPTEETIEFSDEDPVNPEF